MKYPKECVTGKTRKTFSVDANLTLKSDEIMPDGSVDAMDAPLEYFSKYSRFKFNILDGSSASANVSVQDVAAMYEKTRSALTASMFLSQNSSIPSSPAYTVRIKGGNLDGKTPAEALIENGASALNSQYKYLMERINDPKCAKFKTANQKVINAIQDASKIGEDEIRKNLSGSSSGLRTNIYTSFRGNPHKKNEEGLCFCTELDVTYISTEDYPVKISIKNYYAPIEEKETGQIIVQSKQKDLSTEQSYTFDTTMEFWLGALEDMQNTVREFRMLHARKMWDMAETAEKENRKAHSQGAA